MRVLTLGDNINTDDIIPAARCTTADPQFLRQYALEHVIGAGELMRYDRIEAGRNFGCGSSRENAPIAIKAAGVQGVRARSFAEIFYRNSVNIGLPLEVHGQPSQDPVVDAIIEAGGLTPFNQQRRDGRRTVPHSQTPPRPMTMTEKLLARGSGNDYVRPGETVFVEVDLAMSHDAVAGPVADQFYACFGRDAKVWDADRVVLVADHFIQVNDIRSDQKAPLLHQQMRDFASEQNCRLLDEVAPGEAEGICHILLPERGYIRPGMIIAGTDSHTCTYGAFGCFATGVGTTDMANLLAMGDLWIRVPETMVLDLDGVLPDHVCAKDILLFVLGQIGCDGAAGRVLEFRGRVVENLPIDERLTLANMAIECGAVCGLIAADATTVGSDGGATLEDDPGCAYAAYLRFDLSDLAPQVACPPKPDAVVAVRDLDDTAITKAYIGSCTGGKLFDLQQAAEVLDGRRVADGVQMFVVPASQRVRQQAEERGYLQALEQAGARILKSGCGACINAGIGSLDKNETGIFATNRNFRGRSGDPTASNYLASPRVVAISAVRGKITDQLE